MKKAILSALVLFMSASAFANPRAYRIVRGTTTDNGYSIGLGVSGEVTDFEKIESQGEDVVNKFIEDKYDKMINVVLDLETETPLVTVSSGIDNGISGWLGDRYLGNKFSLALTDVNATNQPENSDVLVVTQESNWWTSISSILVIKRELGKTQIIGSSASAGTDFLKQIEAKLRGKVRNTMVNGASRINLVQKPEMPGGVLNFKLEIEIPKTTETGYTIDGVATLTVDSKFNPILTLKKIDSIKEF